jgi:hypothetical protein
MRRIVTCAIWSALVLPGPTWAQSPAVTDSDDDVIQCCRDSFNDGAREVLSTDHEEMAERLKSVGKSVRECYDCAASYLRDTMDHIRPEDDQRGH